MIDGLKKLHELNNFQAWKEAAKIDFHTSTNIETGVIKEKLRNVNGGIQKTITHNGKFETFELKVKEIQRTSITGIQSVNYYLTIDGSLHKNHFQGANYLPFTWDQLQQQITHLENSLQLNSKFIHLSNLEIGLNITLPFAVYPYLKRNLLAYKGIPFDRYKPDKNKVCLGYVCPLTHYSVKVYDKGLQNKLPENMLRFELRFLKMQTLNKRGIIKFSDLKDFKKVNNLLDLLLDGWNNVMLYDDSINLTKPNIKETERELLRLGSNSKFWEHLKETNIRKFNYQRDKFKKLISKHGKNIHQTISDLIKTEWENLFKICTNLPTGKTPELYKSTIKIKGKNVQTPFPVSNIELEELELIKKEYSHPVKREGKEFSYIEKRVCITCGKPLNPGQRSNSKYCSAKFVGEATAHQCRNINSNPRNNLKNKIERITGKGVLFDIRPYLIDNNNKKQSYAI